MGNYCNCKTIILIILAIILVITFISLFNNDNNSNCLNGGLTNEVTFESVLKLQIMLL